ncbi:hypothetical protein [Flavobacterium psychrophilum]|uniref:hypothetical protein n=1 Tax=Flavobacterium psychrophilum TaxID=96345 RepID=UPI00106CF58C|nr:hypothetical protein [Flavobacterium psychrophilum]
MNTKSEKKLNYWYLIASFLSIVMGCIHVFIGGPKLNDPIQQSTLSNGIRTVSEVAWHSFTATYVLMSVALLYLSNAPKNTILAKYIIVQLVVFSMLFLSYSVMRFGDIKSH